MIEKTRISHGVEDIRRSRKQYYLITVDGKPEGISTRYETAVVVALHYAKMYNAKPVDSFSDLYCWHDDSGPHFITVSQLPRLSMSYEKDKD